MVKIKPHNIDPEWGQPSIKETAVLWCSEQAMPPS